MKTKKLFRLTFDPHTADLLLIGLLVVLLIVCDLAVFVDLGPQPASAPVQETQNAPTISNDQLDSLVAPIALWPDPLLTQALVASTYPPRVGADRWLPGPG